MKEAVFHIIINVLAASSIANVHAQELRWHEVSDKFGASPYLFVATESTWCSYDPSDDRWRVAAGRNGIPCEVIGKDIAQVLSDEIKTLSEGRYTFKTAMTALPMLQRFTTMINKTVPSFADCTLFANAEGGIWTVLAPNGNQDNPSGLLLIDGTTKFQVPVARVEVTAELGDAVYRWLPGFLKLYQIHPSHKFSAVGGQGVVLETGSGDLTAIHVDNASHVKKDSDYRSFSLPDVMEWPNFARSQTTYADIVYKGSVSEFLSIDGLDELLWRSTMSPKIWQTKTEQDPRILLVMWSTR